MGHDEYECVVCRGSNGCDNDPHSAMLCGVCIDGVFADANTTSRMMYNVQKTGTMSTEQVCECCNLEKKFLMNVCVCPNCLNHVKAKVTTVKKSVSGNGEPQEDEEMINAIQVVITSMSMLKFHFPLDVTQHFHCSDFEAIVKVYVEENEEMYFGLSPGDLMIQRQLDKELIELSKPLGIITEYVEKMKSLAKRMEDFLKIRGM
jgi:hypothetical protein